jgi:hypothetical protein
MSHQCKASAVLFLLLNFRFLPKSFLHAVHETVFLVGPKPQPIVFDKGDDPLSVGNKNDSDPVNSINVPLSTISIQVDSGGSGRKLNERRTFDSLDTAWEPKDEQMAPRSLFGEMCNVTKTILSLAFDDNDIENFFLFIPGSPSGAAGASRLVAVANSMIASASRNGSPQVSRIWLAVSKNENPDIVIGWNQFYINSIISIGGSASYAGSISLELDEEAVYITASMFRFSDNAFAGVRYWFFRKGVVGGFYDGGDLSFLSSNPFAGGGTPTTTVPTQVHGSSGVDGSVGTFFVSVASTGATGEYDLQIYTLFNPLSASPSFSFQKIGLGAISQSFEMPPAPQLGSTAQIYTQDSRVLDAVWRNNKLWVVLTIKPVNEANQGQATVLWVRCSTSGGNVTFEAQGELGGEGIARGTYTFYPSVAVNRRGLAAYGYSASSNTTFVGSYASVGMSDQSYAIKSGLAPYFRSFGSVNNLWGYYSGISVDPTDDSFWIFNQFADTVGNSVGGTGNGRWGTVWGRLECTVRFLCDVPNAVVLCSLIF